jgi:hypothetical protein
MEKILLVEPDYQNKFPPIGLMKIASYHRGKKDYVEFYKGKAPYTTIMNFDRVYITTLFTFYYDLTVDTIQHYLNYMHKDNVYVGGISATLLVEKYKKELGIENVIVGQLTSSSLIGYKDSINIDELPLDYDILDDVEYKYPSGDHIFIYTTRGCLRGCEFCAVSKLEPTFKDTNHIVNQIEAVRQKYGDKRNVLIMDNNILYSKELNKVVQNLNSLGHINNTPNYIEPNYFEIMLKKIKRRKEYKAKYDKQVAELTEYLNNFISRIGSKQLSKQYQQILDYINKEKDKIRALKKVKKDIIPILEKYRFKKKLQRYVDFNQGLDARLLTEDKMKIMSNIAIKPFRLAYDSSSEEKTYKRAFNNAYSHGVKYFSNYMLYNYKDSPFELWKRLRSTILLYENKQDIQAFSFPMKYAPINMTSRDYIGEKWNKKYLSAINAILNVTKGVVAKEKDFFYEAFGSKKKEFIEILTMPNHFIKNRMLFKKSGHINTWKQRYNRLNGSEKKILLKYLCGLINEIEIKNKKIISIIELYKPDAIPATLRRRGAKN